MDIEKVTDECIFVSSRITLIYRSACSALIHLASGWLPPMPLIEYTRQQPNQATCMIKFT